MKNPNEEDPQAGQTAEGAVISELALTRASPNNGIALNYRTSFWFLRAVKRSKIPV